MNQIKVIAVLLSFKKVKVMRGVLSICKPINLDFVVIRSIILLQKGWHVHFWIQFAVADLQLTNTKTK